MRWILPLFLFTVLALAVFVSASMHSHAAQEPSLPEKNCVPNKTYRLGKEPGAALDLCLLSAEYKATREKAGPFYLWPDADHKLFVVRFTIANPLAKAVPFDQTIRWTAIMKDGTTFETRQAYTKEAPNGPLKRAIPQGQKVELLSVFLLPFQGAVDKLVGANLFHSRSEVATYSVGEFAVKIPPPYVDPRDPSGATALQTVHGAVGETYDVGNYDIAVLGVTTTTGIVEAIDGSPPDRDHAYAFVTYRITNRNREGGTPSPFGSGFAEQMLVDSGGGKYSAYNHVFRTENYGVFSPIPQFDETTQFRMAFDIKRGANLTELRLRDEFSKQIIIDLKRLGTPSPSSGTPGNTGGVGQQTNPPTPPSVKTPGQTAGGNTGGGDSGGTPGKDDTSSSPVWGVADLHAHPASHFAFGATSAGGGMFWGTPGGALDVAASTLATDMPPCEDCHYKVPLNLPDPDIVRNNVRTSFITMIDSLTGWTHGKEGSGSFASWPSAESVNHQQMHILCIRRAYEGGLRLMIASVADNQMLSTLWQKMGRPANPMDPADFMRPDPNREFESALLQIDHIQQVAMLNSDWMEIVKSPEEARAAIKANKLALILGLEMDSLNTTQILDLVKNHGVRQVVPVHLADNPSFGGSAVYNDAFNTNNWYLNKTFWDVISNPKVRFSAGRPQKFVPAFIGRINGIGGLYSGAWEPQPISDQEFGQLGYTTKPGGHINAKGLVPGSLQPLMKEGLLIDVAHMGVRTTLDALVAAEALRYPLMDSHTGLREADDMGESERDLLRYHAARMATLGGVIGLGTTGDRAKRTLISQRKAGAKSSDYLFRFSGDQHDYSPPLMQVLPDAHKVIWKLRLTLTLGEDGLSDGTARLTFDPADVFLLLKNGQLREFRDISQGKPWEKNVTKTVDLPLPAGVKIGDLSKLTIHGNGKGGPFGDNWNLDAVLLEAVLVGEDPLATWLNEYEVAARLMDAGGVGFGTDFNGLSPQMPFLQATVTYPFARPVAPGISPGEASAQKLDAPSLGSKTFALRTDGLAHYGMLADFLEAVRTHPKGSLAYQSLFKSADRVLKMWEKAVAASKNVGSSAGGGKAVQPQQRP